MPLARIPLELTSRPFLRREALTAGLTPRQLQGASWRRITKDAYAAAHLPDTPALRAAAVSLVLPIDAVTSGCTAAWLHGVDLRRRPDDPIEVTIPPRATCGPRHGVLFRRAPLTDDDVVLIRGVRTTSPVRTGFDLARRSPLVEGVVALDALLNARVVDIESMAIYLADHRRWRGVRLVEAALVTPSRAPSRPRSPGSECCWSSAASRGLRLRWRFSTPTAFLSPGSTSGTGTAG